MPLELNIGVCELAHAQHKNTRRIVCVYFLPRVRQSRKPIRTCKALGAVYVCARIQTLSHSDSGYRAATR